MDIFFEQLRLVQGFELFAALAGSFYLYKTKESGIIRYFVWFLWVTFFVELVGLYTAVAYYSNYELLSFVKDTPFAGNYWIYNIYSIAAFVMYVSLFALSHQDKSWRKALLFILGIYVLGAVLNLILSDVYFKAHSSFTFIVGTVVVILAIGKYYYELLRSNEILSITTSIRFYISVGALVYHLGFVPLVIYSRYYRESSPEFVEIYIFVLYGINYFLYSLYTLGFLLCSRKKRSY